MVDKKLRLTEICRRLTAAPAFFGFQSARTGLETIMTNVEDELSGIPNNPDAATSPTDGRIYPPHDSREIPTGVPGVRTFKHVRHRTSIGANGALEFVTSTDVVILEKAGADGSTVQDLRRDHQQATTPTVTGQETSQ